MGLAEPALIGMAEGTCAGCLVVEKRVRGVGRGGRDEWVAHAGAVAGEHAGRTGAGGLRRGEVVGTKERGKESDGDGLVDDPCASAVWK